MGTKDRKLRELEKRRRLILDKSRDLFFRKGFDNVTIDEICTAIEYGRSALYKLFQSKEEIYFNICIEGINLLGESLMDLNMKSYYFEEEFLRIPKIFVKFFFEQKNYYEAMLFFTKNKQADLSISNELFDRMLDVSRIAMNPIDLLVARGIELGILKKADYGRIIILFKVSLTGLLDKFFLDRDSIEMNIIEEFCLDHARIYLNGLKSM